MAESQPTTLPTWDLAYPSQIPKCLSTLELQGRRPKRWGYFWGQEMGGGAGLNFCSLHLREVRGDYFLLMANHSLRDSKPQLRK